MSVTLQNSKTEPIHDGRMASIASGSMNDKRLPDSSFKLQLPRILFIGESWYGSCARACCSALRRLGCDVTNIDVHTCFPAVRRSSSRILIRLLQRQLVTEYNDLIMDTARLVKPQVLIAFKGTYLRAETLRRLRREKILLYNYFPDTSPFAHKSLYPDSLGEYDCVFYTKYYWKRERFLRMFRRAVFVPHGYDPEVHHPWPKSETLREQRGEVVGVAVHTSHKEEVLDGVARAMPSLDIAIWGNGWRERCRSKRLMTHVLGYGVCGTAYAKILSGATINLAIMSGTVKGVAQGDETSTRTYEIPACRGFMLHERSPELLRLFEEDNEVACFDGAEEAVDKIRFYLSNPADRNRIARAGYARCVPAYSYDNRMAEILRWHWKDLPKLARCT
jgi:spore maturation protein CgeB